MAKVKRTKFIKYEVETFFNDNFDDVVDDDDDDDDDYEK